ncbi:MAG: NifB/NifX family molybdenum-iron cluster-binding protein [Ignavibacteriaceae bacterium]
MLVLTGSDKNNLESPIAKRFGHSKYFIFYNTETKTFESFENKGEEHSHKNLEEFLDKGVETFIVGNIGPHAFEIINTPKSKVYLARKMSVQEAIEKFLNSWYSYFNSFFIDFYSKIFICFLYFIPNLRAKK